MKFDVYSAIKGNSVSMHLQKLKINPWIVFINLTCQENLEKCFRLYSEFWRENQILKFELLC